MGIIVRIGAHLLLSRKEVRLLGERFGALASYTGTGAQYLAGASGGRCAARRGAYGAAPEEGKGGCQSSRGGGISRHAASTAAADPGNITCDSGELCGTG